jgi:hypothetical protein
VPEQLLTDRERRSPVTVIPLDASQRVTCVKQLCKGNIAIARYRHEGRSFHLYSDTPFLDPPVHPSSGLSIHGVSCPSTSSDEGNPCVCQGLLERRHTSGLGVKPCAKGLGSAATFLHPSRRYPRQRRAQAQGLAQVRLRHRLQQLSEIPGQ